MKTCILLATYNEKESIKQILDKLTAYDVVIVDDSSPDGTGDICKLYNNVTLITRPRKSGIASAYVEGFKYILASSNQYDIIVQMDAGGTHDPNSIPDMIEFFKNEECDLVIGSRFTGKTKIKSRRTILSKVAAFLMKGIGTTQRDVTSGFRVWNANLLRKIQWKFINARGFAFQLQLLYHTIFLNGKIREYSIPYILTNSSLNTTIIIEAYDVWFSLLVEKHVNYNITLKQAYYDKKTK